MKVKRPLQYCSIFLWQQEKFIRPYRRLFISSIFTEKRAIFMLFSCFRGDPSEKTKTTFITTMIQRIQSVSVIEKSIQSGTFSAYKDKLDKHVFTTFIFPQKYFLFFSAKNTLNWYQHCVNFARSILLLQINTGHIKFGLVLLHFRQKKTYCT